jgi:hypothetical protein
MPGRTGPSRFSIDLEEQASLVEVSGGAALVAAAVLLAVLGLFRVFHRHPDDGWFYGALVLAGAGLVVLVASLAAGAVSRGRGPRWAGSVDVSTPGVLLFLLEPAPARAGPAAATRRLGPVRCQVALAGGSPATAPDDRISRVRGLLMTRYHPSFFAGVQYPVSGTYHFQWEERVGEEWRTLVAGSAEVVVRQPSPDDPDWGIELARRVGSPAVAGLPAGEQEPEAPAAQEPAGPLSG